MNVKFERKVGLIVVPVEVSGPKGTTTYEFALDTGASVTLMNWDVLMRLGYDPAVSRRRLPLTTASGTEYAPLVRIERIAALGQVRQEVGVLCHTLPPRSGLKGLLGLDFMRGRKLTLDFREGTISLD